LAAIIILRRKNLQKETKQKNVWSESNIGNSVLDSVLRL
jgi:hypothetical protein